MDDYKNNTNATESIKDAERAENVADKYVGGNKNEANSKFENAVASEKGE